MSNVVTLAMEAPSASGLQAFQGQQMSNNCSCASLILEEVGQNFKVLLIEHTIGLIIYAIFRYF